MKRKLIFISLIFLLAIAGYFLWFNKDKTLRFVPKNADFVVLIDVKKASQQYIFDLVQHPGLWLGNSNDSFRNNGIAIPDFIQIFHLKNTNFTEWYSIFEISDKDNFLNFINGKGFKLNKNGIYSKDQISIKIDGSKCLLGFSNSAFEKVATTLLGSNDNRNLEADQLINSSIGSVSYLSNSQIQNFSIDLNNDNIEIKNNSEKDIFATILSGLENKIPFLRFELDSKNIQKVSQLLNKKLDNSLNLNSVSGVADLEMVNDKIISYGYDDNFNEVEKVSYQKIVQPNYAIKLQSLDVDKTWNYFQKQKWINAQNQFTLIPFQPNLIKQNGNNIGINSTRKSIPLEKTNAENFIFIKNSALLSNSFKTFSKEEKKLVSNIDYLFYGNKAENYYLKLQFKKKKLPLILRW